MDKLTVPTAICCHEDWWHLEATIASVRNAGPVTVFVSDVAWNGTPGDPTACIEAAERTGAEVVRGSWDSEASHRAYALHEMRRRGHSQILIPDSDEVVSPELLDQLLRIAAADISDVVRVRMATYWASPCYVIHPPEQLAPILMLDCRTSEHVHIREYSGVKPISLGPEHGLLHHLSYVGPDERIRRKIETWGHRNELVPDWYKEKWQGWKKDRSLRELHPTHPFVYGWTERIDKPDLLKNVPDFILLPQDPQLTKRRPKVSIVIPLYGGAEDIRLCLESLEKCRSGPEGIAFETVVVDDCSPDDAAKTVETFADVTLVRNPENLGFGAACNRGFEESSGDVVIFLNSDTIVPRAGLIRLIEALMASGTVGAAGPYTNYSGYHQQVSPTYTSLDNLDNFARDFASREVKDQDLSMLVGFCLAVRRSVLEEVGVFDTRFGQGLFEDTDLIYRIQRAGYKLRLASRSYVHHAGSKSLARASVPAPQLLQRNQILYRDKWREDLESGFASHLAGIQLGPIVFNPAREPGLRRELLREKAQRADISLCMIVRNEERVLKTCLDSVAGVFAQVIVVDTGSTDRTIEIAKESGAEVYEIPWPDSFSEARNESLKHAKGKWIFWLDADDTLPFSTAEEIVDAALSAPANVIGFRVRVQFVDDGPSGGTRVDHVKLFRNVPGLQFEGHIHEQILRSLRQVGGEIALINGPVLHSGYDTSPEGQRKKRKRDHKLLALDLKANPHHPFYLFNLGMTAFYCNRYRGAAGWLKRSIKYAQAGETHLRKAYALLGMCSLQLGRNEEAANIFFQGLQAVGEDPELRFRLGQLLSSLGRHEEARQHLMAIQGADEFFASLDIGILTFKRLAVLGEISYEMGRHQESKEHFRAALAANPLFKIAAIRLYEICMNTGDVVGAQEAAGALLAMEGPTEEWADLRLKVFAMLGMPEDEALQRLLREAPGGQGPRVLACRSLLQRGREYEAIPILQDLSDTGHAESAFNLGILALKARDYPAAMRATARAVDLEPHNVTFLKQLENLEALFEREELCKMQGTGDRTSIVGPHIGHLGSPKCETSVVIVTYNSEATISKCVRSVLSELAEGDELIIVDNASFDGTIPSLEKEAQRDPRIRLLLNPSNRGYSKACNQGLLRSGGRRLLALNPDTELSPGSLKALLAPLDSGFAACGPVSDNVGGEQFVGFYLQDRHPDVSELGEIFATEHPGEVKETKLLTGFCLALRRDILDQIGLLNEDTELGADDLELCWRLREFDFRLGIALDVFVHHICGVSFGSGGNRDLASVWVRKSDRALVRKLTAYYGWENLPSSDEIWASEIFNEALARAGKSG